MGSEAASAIPSSLVQESFKQLERQQELISCCTVLWKELSDHFSTLERGLECRSEALRSKRQSLDASTQHALDSLGHRELSIGSAVDLALAKLEERRVAAVEALAVASSKVEEHDLAGKLRSLCTKMDFAGFIDFVVAKRKELELLRPELPLSLADCIDPAKFVLDAISVVFPLDNRTVKSPNDLGWACVLILESLVPVLADPELGSTRPLVTRCIRKRAEEMAKAWKEGLEQRGGYENVKPPDAHTFLQHVVTFGIIDKNDKNLYRKLVISFAWRRQMPKLAISLGLEDSMEDIIEELIDKGHQLDAINFAYEASLQDKFPPTSLIQSFLKDLKKSTSTSEETNACGQVVNNTSRKEQSAIRAAIKCIQDHKLESEFPLESLQKQLETLEKVKVEKKKPAVSSPGSGSGSGPANKRTRANHGGPMPPAKAGRTTINACVSSFPAAPAYARSPSAHASYPAPPSYPYDRPTGHAVYGSRSPPAIRESYGYPTEEIAHVPLGASYPSPPMSYPAYGAYQNCTFGGYNNGLAPGYQQAYYR
ncbi:FRIGIDA-like protein 4a isoform X1 [Zingiber officinale]|nr:FRIGIDA-like protein 4a isoform X1 [Zingiber officinale]